MTSLSRKPYSVRGASHSHAVARKLFEIAEAKQSNLIFSADLTDTKSLITAAEQLGPYIVVLKTHVDLVRDFDHETIKALNDLKKKHRFLIFEDRKLVDIGSTVQKQYHGGTLGLSEFADIVNISILSGENIVDALAQTISASDFPHPGERAFIMLAQMSSKGTFAVGAYTQKCIEVARKHPSAVIGWVAMGALTAESQSTPDEGEDFLVFTPGVSMASKGDKLGQQYVTPAEAVGKGTDFIIAGRGIYQSDDPVATAQQYQKAGWEAYLARVSASE